MPTRPLLLALALLAIGCKPEIGDDCKLHTDCSVTGGRICEPNLPGGYCTVFNCEPGGCPEEAVCVAYGTTPGIDPPHTIPPVCDSSLDRRLQRTFCMRACGGQGDCRTGYACLDLTDPTQNPWRAVSVDPDTSRHFICAVPASISPTDSVHSTEVCSPPDASFPEASVFVPDSGAANVPDAARPGDGSTDASDATSRRDATPPDATVPRDAAPDATLPLDGSARDAAPGDGTTP